MQGKISEVELRLYLAGQGAGSADVNKVSRLSHPLGTCETPCTRAAMH
jgi:hypothetical protein